MELQAVLNPQEFKKKFLLGFDKVRKNNPSFNKFIYEISLTNNLFIVGGFLRAVANNEEARDLDLIVNLKKQTLEKVVKDCFLEFTSNRLGGYKIQLEQIVVDTWSVEDNWAFKRKVVKNAETNFLQKIAEGTFFNYDSLVFDLHTFQYSFKHYNECVFLRELDILKKNSNYKKLNPT